MDYTELLNMLGPYLLVTLAGFGISLLITWVLIYSAVKTALRVDREQAEDEKSSLRA